MTCTSLKLYSVGLFLLPLLMATNAMGQSQGVHGTIKADDGSALSFASIYVKQLRTGTTANENGYYEITLPPGRYELVFQHVGKKTEVRVVDVAEGFTELDVLLTEEEILLQTITIDAGAEDPAYSIMRKAIAKANYHRNLLDSYTAKVYIKGAGKLKDYPWLAKRQLEKEGVEKGRVYISESVSEIKFTRPNKFEEKVISIRSDGKDNNTSPNPYIFGSFYEPEVAETVSPLSPKAFSYYRFEYEGTFKDRDYEISRIRVIPRSPGENVIDGVIYIVEDAWSIHSLDIHTVKLGIHVYMKVVCAPIEDKAWLPVSHSFKIDGKVFGFEFEYNYLASVSDYQIKVNPDLYVEKMEVVDEKKEPGRAKEVQKEHAERRREKKDDDTEQLKERLAAGEEITRKELKHIIKEYEKEERRMTPEPEVISVNVFEVDSGAYKKDSAYWATVRPIPLTHEEVRGYEKADSIAAVERAEAEGDTLKASKHKGFQPWDVLVGDSYRIGEHSNFRIYAPDGNFNTVEGTNLIYRVAVGTVLQDTNRTRVSLSPVFRYAFARKTASGYARFQIRNRKQRLEIEGGRYVDQYNADDPILPLVNSFTTLLLEQNLMKLYERDFGELRYRRVINPFLALQTTWSLADRRELVNHSDYKLVNRKEIEDYTPNKPVNLELDDTGFDEHRALVGSIRVDARPWLKYRIRNGRKYPIRNSSPSLSLSYRKGFNDVFGSAVDFDHLEAGVRHEVEVGARGTIDFSVRAGTFLNRDSMTFVDFKHFQGNRTPFMTSDPVGSFRFLDYYRYSTNDKYVTANVHYQFRKFLLTTIPQVRLMGIRENIFASFLATPTAGHYTELGYSIDGILRFFRIEGGAWFKDGRYQDFGFRIGIATSLTVEFAD